MDSPAAPWQFPFSVRLKIESSEPRDVLQLERTFLTFLRFSMSLIFTSLAIVQHFRLNTSGKSDPFRPRTRFTVPVSFTLVGLAVFALSVSAVNYFVTVNRYAQHKIQTHGVYNAATVVCMTCIMVGMIALCTLLIIESYMNAV